MQTKQSECCSCFQNLMQKYSHLIRFQLENIKVTYLSKQIFEAKKKKNVSSTKFMIKLLRNNSRIFFSCFETIFERIPLYKSSGKNCFFLLLFWLPFIIILHIEVVIDCFRDTKRQIVFGSFG